MSSPDVDDALRHGDAETPTARRFAAAICSAPGRVEFVRMVADAPGRGQLEALVVMLLPGVDAPRSELPEGMPISGSVGVALWPDDAAADTAWDVCKRRPGQQIGWCSVRPYRKRRLFGRSLLGCGSPRA
jgi:hypothetical protein